MKLPDFTCSLILTLLLLPTVWAQDPVAPQVPPAAPLTSASEPESTVAPPAPQLTQTRIFTVETVKDLQQTLATCDRITASLTLRGLTLVLDFQEGTELEQLRAVLSESFKGGLLGKNKVSPPTKKDAVVLPGLDLAFHHLPKEEPPMLQASEYTIGSCWLAEPNIPEDLRALLAQYLQRGAQHFGS